jgi:hypothetical protein
MNLGNARRVLGDSSGDTDLLMSAAPLVADAHEGYKNVYGDDHPYTNGCALNLAIIRRRIGEKAEARRLLEDAYVHLERRLGSGHHDTLVCKTSLATSLWDAEDYEEARRLGEEALSGLRASTINAPFRSATDDASLSNSASSDDDVSVVTAGSVPAVGDDHPHTLVTMANLAIDTRMSGDKERAVALHTEAVERYKAILPEDHFDVKDAVLGERIAIDFEPPPL